MFKNAIIAAAIFISFDAMAVDTVTAEANINSISSVQRLINNGTLPHIVVNGKPIPVSKSVLVEFDLHNGSIVPEGKYVIIRAYIQNNFTS